MMYIWLIVGFILLVKGADYFVEGSSSIAKFLKVPSVIIGLTIVSLGTSAPEAAVSITAGFSGKNQLALSNVIGSNLFNLLFIIGICGMIKSFKSQKDIVKRDLPVNLSVSVIYLVFIVNRKISRLEGIISLILMIGYLVILIRNAMKNRIEENDDIKVLSPIKSILFILCGIAAIVFGGNIVVKNASLIAEKFGMSDTLIGLTIIAIGTSLPELVTSIVAARKGESELALGNAVGSSIFNLLFILGMSTTLTPIVASTENLIDMFVLIFATLVVWVVSKSKGIVTKIEGALCIIMYLGYMFYAIVR